MRCFIHSKRNVEERLNTLPARERNIIIQYIFGKVEVTHKYEGLVHAADTDIFTVLTESIKDKWNSIKLPNLTASIEGPSFHSWSVKNIRPYMGKHMVTNIRERNAISCDFSTDQSESLNAKLRRKTDYRANELELFLRIVKDVYDTQEEENRQAFISEGDFEMSDFFRHFSKGESYNLLSTKQRKSLENSFYKASISHSQKQLERKDSKFSIPGIDNSYSDNIIHKADSIIDNDGVAPFITQLGSYHVINSQGGRPHFVAECKDGRFLCDNREKRYGCIGFNSSGVCSLTVAVAKYSGNFNAYMQYLDKRLTGKSSRNQTNIAQYGIKSGAGKKSGSQRNRKRKPEVLETGTSIQQNSPIKKLKIIRHNDTHVTVQQHNKEFVLVSLKDHPRVRSCGGCSYQLLKSYPLPDDIAIALKEYDSSRDAQAGVLRRSNNLANRYYQPNPHCVRKGNNVANNNFQFTDLDISTVELEDAHKVLLSTNFGCDL